MLSAHLQVSYGAAPALWGVFARWRGDTGRLCCACLPRNGAGQRRPDQCIAGIPHPCRLQFVSSRPRHCTGAAATPLLRKRHRVVPEADACSRGQRRAARTLSSDAPSAAAKTSAKASLRPRRVFPALGRKDWRAPAGALSWAAASDVADPPRALMASGLSCCCSRLARPVAAHRARHVRLLSGASTPKAFRCFLVA